MIKYKAGCLIKAAQNGEVNVVAHQCNCWVTMGSGFALAIKRAFPSAWEADKQTVKGGRSKLGKFSKGVEQGVSIYNLYGQYYYGRNAKQTDYVALTQSLIAMREDLQENAIIGLPRIGAGLAGGEWEVIEGIINDELDGYDVTVYVV